MTSHPLVGPLNLPLQYLKISKAAFNIPHKLAIAFLYCDDDREEKEKKKLIKAKNQLEVLMSSH